MDDTIDEVAFWGKTALFFVGSLARDDINGHCYIGTLIVSDPDGVLGRARRAKVAKSSSPAVRLFTRTEKVFASLFLSPLSSETSPPTRLALYILQTKHSVNMVRLDEVSLALSALLPSRRRRGQSGVQMSGTPRSLALADSPYSRSTLLDDRLSR